MIYARHKYFQSGEFQQMVMRGQANLQLQEMILWLFPQKTLVKTADQLYEK
jgi:hypothetical protein